MKAERNLRSLNKSLLSFLFILLTSQLITNKLNATNYYISASGDDGADGLTPATAWQSIAKVNNSFSLLPVGSTFYFNRGDTFYGTITINKSGTSGSPITLSAYGTGAKPIITGFTTITSGWTNEGGGIYSKSISTSILTNMVTIDGKQVGMGRYPDTGFLTYESAATNKSITDNELGASPDWTGAGIAIRKNNWTLDRGTITSHVGTLLTYSDLGSGSNATAGFGYFIMNDKRTLTSYGEWYHDPVSRKFYMYFGAVDPNTKVVQVALLNNIIYNSGGYDYITVDNLNITGAINNALYLTSADDFCNILNCDISFCGNNGIDLGSGTNCIVDNNTIRDCNSNGIYSNYGFLSTITNNTITNIGIITGQSNYKQGIEGIYLPGNGGVISYNTIKKVGYNGISLRYTGGSTVSYNYIDSVCLVLNDGGGIYMSNTITSPRIIDHNIITNAIGNVSGTPGYGSSAEGIYLDEYSSSVVVTNNTVANSGNSGIKLHKAHNDIITDNTTFNCGTGMDIQNSNVITDYIHDISLRRNIFFAKMPNQFAIYFHTKYDDNITLFGIADSNYYVRPMDDNQTIKVSQPTLGLKYMSLESWQAFSLQDAHSKKSPITLTNANDIRFEYNVTKSPTTISLAGKYITADSKIYDGSITLQPYTSAVLMKYNNTDVESQLANSKGIKIYPNPVSNQFSIEVEGNNVNHNFEIVSSTGQLVLNGKISDKTVVDSSNLNSGIYFVKIDRGSDIAFTKIIKL